MAQSRPLFPQALSSAFAHRLATTANPLYSSLSNSRQAKRQANKVNYAEDFNDLDLDFEFDDNVSNNDTHQSATDSVFNGHTMDSNNLNDLNGLDYGNLIGNDQDNDNNNNNNDITNNDFINDNKDNDEDYVDDDDERKDATYEDPNAAYDIYRNLILNSNNNSKINLSHFHGNKEAPTELPNINFTPQQILENINEDLIIPIKIKINTSGAIINDSFLWNLNDNLTTPELFASIISQELDLHRNTEALIVNQIKDQIQSYTDLLANPNNAIIDQFLLNEKEFHVVLDISANIGEDFYTDKIEWNLLDKSITPEIFAKSVVSDIGLKPEFETAISIAIYDEIYKFKRELIENPQQVSQNIDSLPFFNLINQDMALNSIVQGLRYDIKKYGEEFSPSIEKLSEWEIEKRETEKERNLRRRKRETLRVVSGVVR